MLADVRRAAGARPRALERIETKAITILATTPIIAIPDWPTSPRPVDFDSTTAQAARDDMQPSLIRNYLASKPTTDVAPAFLAYLANLETVARVSPEVARAIVQELADQRGNIKLIASENYSSLAAQCAMGNLLTDKYAEGIPHRRFYAGCDNVDTIEDLANARARELFGADHAYAQPHSGADANLVAFWAILRGPGRSSRRWRRLKGVEGPGALTPADWTLDADRAVERRSATSWATSGCSAWTCPRAAT